MELSAWLDLHADDLLVSAGLLVTLAAAVGGAVYGCELILRGMHRIGQWRVKQLHQAQQALAIRLAMEGSARQHRMQGEQRECARLRHGMGAATRQLEELRQLLHAQGDALAGRAERIAALDGEQARAAADLAAAQAQAEAQHARCADLAAQGAQLSSDLAQREQVISMLDQQRATQQHAAELAQAGLADARVQIALLQERLQAAEERCALLADLREARGQRSADAAVPAGRATGIHPVLGAGAC